MSAGGLGSCPHRQSLFLPCNNPDPRVTLKESARVSGSKVDFTGTFRCGLQNGCGGRISRCSHMRTHVHAQPQTTFNISRRIPPLHVPAWLGLADFLQCSLPHTSLRCCPPLCPLGTPHSLLFSVSGTVGSAPAPACRPAPSKASEPTPPTCSVSCTKKALSCRASKHFALLIAVLSTDCSVTYQLRDYGQLPNLSESRVAQERKDNDRTGGAVGGTK